MIIILYYHPSLIDKYYNFYSKNDLCTPIYQAIITRNVEMVKYLLDKKINLWMSTKKNDIGTGKAKLPWEIALCLNKTEEGEQILKLLKENQADIIDWCYWDACYDRY